MCQKEGGGIHSAVTGTDLRKQVYCIKRLWRRLKNSNIYQSRSTELQEFLSKSLTPRVLRERESKSTFRCFRRIKFKTRTRLQERDCEDFGSKNCYSGPANREKRVLGYYPL